MIWTPEEVAEARGLSMWRIFDEPFLARAGFDAEKVVKEIMFREFRDALHALFLEADPYDVQVVSMPDPTGLGARVRAEWNPGECPVEFVGGPAHGWNPRSAVDPKRALIIRTPTFQGTASRWVGPSYHPVSPTMAAADYRPWGWNPETRAWVYTYEGTN